MRSGKFYDIFMYGTVIVITAFVITFCDYVYPAFYTYDMCSKQYMQSQSNGQLTIYDRKNSQELINACYNAKNILLNPFQQILVTSGFAYLTLRYMLFGSKKEFVSRNPVIHYRWHKDTSSKSPLKDSEI